MGRIENNKINKNNSKSNIYSCRPKIYRLSYKDVELLRFKKPPFYMEYIKAPLGGRRRSVADYVMHQAADRMFHRSSGTSTHKRDRQPHSGTLHGCSIANQMLLTAKCSLSYIHRMCIMHRIFTPCSVNAHPSPPFACRGNLSSQDACPWRWAFRYGRNITYFAPAVILAIFHE